MTTVVKRPRRPARPAGIGDGSAVGPPELAWDGDLGSLLGGERSAATTAVMLRWMRARRWFKAKTRRPQAVELVDAIPVPDGPRPAIIALLHVTYSDGEPDLYAVPLVTRDEAEVERLLSVSPQAAIARLNAPGMAPAVLLDGMLVPAFSEALLGLIGGRRRSRTHRGDLLGIPTRAFRALRGPNSERLAAVPLRGEQSNSSAILGDRIILKLYRALEYGPHPDVEVSRFLAEHGYGYVPAMAGTIEYTRSGAQRATVASAQAYVPNGGDLWELAQDAVTAFLEQTQAEEALPPEDDPTGNDIIERSREEPPPIARRLIGAYLETARLLGTRTGQLHQTLASDPNDPEFAPEPISPLHQRALYQSIRSLAGESLRLLELRRDALPEHLRSGADRVLGLSGNVDARLRPLIQHRIGGMRIRIHGDYHLGQVLHTGRDIAIIDFEGEPGRPLGERRLKQSPLTDVAGMVRSFHYAAFGALMKRSDMKQAAGAVPLRRWAGFWYDWVAATFLRGYRDVTEGAPFLPPDDEGTLILLDALVLAKASYELRYELNSRPDWVGIPLAGIEELLSR